MKVFEDLELSGATGAAALSEEGKRLSHKLVTARRACSALPDFPGELPGDLATAYAVQAHSIVHWDDDIAGWKVGGIPPAWRERLGADWLIGPIYARSVRTVQSGMPTAMPVFAGGFAAIEPEFIVQLGNSRVEDRMFIGAEIASSPVPAINDHGPTAVVCDFGNNNGLLIGEEIQDWQGLSGPIEVKTWIDGELIGTRTLHDVFESALDARDFCLFLSQSLGRDLQPGTFISSGAITGVHEAPLGARSEIDFGPLGSFELELVRAVPLEDIEASQGATRAI